MTEYNTLLNYRLFLLICIIILASCKQKDLLYSDGAPVQIEIVSNWKNLKVMPHGVTAIFYPYDDTPPIEFLSNSVSSFVAKLPKGIYRMILFNNSVDYFDNIAFFDTDRYDTFKVVSRGEEPERTPDEFAFIALDRFEVTDEMERQSQRFELHTTPELLTYQISIDVDVVGIVNLLYAYGTIDNVIRGVTLSTEEPLTESGVLRFDFSKATVAAGSYCDGRLKASCVSLGFPSESDMRASNQRLTIKSLLKDGKTVVEKSYNISARTTIDKDSRLISIAITSNAVQPPDRPEDSDDFLYLPNVEVGPESEVSAEIDPWSGTVITVPL